MAIKSYVKRLNPGVVIIMAMVASACTEDESVSTLTFEAKQAPFTVSIPAKGELKATDEIVLSAPRANRGSLTLAWLVEENSIVKKGQVVARFDGEQHLIKRDKAQLSFDKNQLTKVDTNRNLQVNESSIESQSRVLSQEIDMSERFSTEDLAVYSKNEIIEQLLNKDYLQAKDQFLAWSIGSQSAQGNAQIELLTLKGKAFSDKVNMHQKALENLEIIAPADGIFVYEKNWRGEKVRAGQSLWSGSKLGSIPDLTNMKAIVYILETQASGLKAGQVVDIKLDAYPKQKVSGKVTKIASIAASREKDNPVKFFEVEVSIDKTLTNIMQPGQKLEATIEVASIEQALSVPNQVLYQKNGQFWLFVKSSQGFVKRIVEVGQRSLTKSQITSGLNIGEHIALTKPQEVAGHE